jgi:hypothetical protein
MGLDQYLYANKNIGSAEWRGAEENKQFSEVLNAMNATRMTEKADFPHASISIEVAYWRKANQIHGWFVKHVQGGDDDCREYYVDRDQVRELLVTCQAVMQDRSKAEKLLPPTEGFFFGSDGIDEWYWQDIENTIDMLSYVLDNVDTSEWSLYYRSSW